MLVNDIEETPAKAINCIFQPKLEILSHHNDFVFTESNANIDSLSMDDEERSLELLYRNE